MNVPILLDARFRKAELDHAAALGATIAAHVHAAWEGVKRAARWIAAQNDAPRWPDRRLSLSQTIDWGNAESK